MTRKQVVWVVFLVVSCARRFEVDVLRPPELDVSRVKTLIVGELQGKGAKEVQRDLAGALDSSTDAMLLLPDTVRQMLQPKGLPEETAIDQRLLPILRQNFNGAALLIGDVEQYRVEQSVEMREERDYDELGMLRSYQLIKRRVWVTVEATFQIIDCQSGRVVALRGAKSLIETSTDETRYDPRQTTKPPEPPYIDERILFAKARQQVISTIVNAVSPHMETTEVTLYTELTTPKLSRGVSLAKEGLWAQAAEIFAEIAQEEPKSDKALFNAGVAYAQIGKPEKALPYLQRAYQLNPSERYQQEIARCKKLLEQKESN